MFNHHRCLGVLTASVSVLAVSQARAATLPASPLGLAVSVDEKSGGYRITATKPGWTFEGSVEAPLLGVTVSKNRDALGTYQQIRFGWQSALDKTKWVGTIRSYDARPLISFSLTSPQGKVGTAPDFPSFATFPDKLHALSFQDSVFSPPAFRLAQTSTPWVLFDDAAQTAIISPASDFIVSQMHGDGKEFIASGMNPQIAKLPAGFTHTSFLVVDSGVGKAFRSWGDALTDLSGKPRPTDESDELIKYLGYWTDNGGHYYYNYDKEKGYVGTLLALRQHYKEQGIPLRYLQLDSWWYQKSHQSPNGSMEGPSGKNANLPRGNWNAYGGTLDYSASPDLFPQGLAAFNKQIGLPFTVHARWIDPASPYAQKYKISGVAPVDPRWWNERMAYLKASGVKTYEQDWLNELYAHSPQMARDLETGPGFTDNMARSAQANGITLQYCMATSRFFLQGSKYPNLTTIRTSEDRFEVGKWNSFLYTSLYADALRVRPWTDVFKSTENGNLTISVLSSGPVGVGDEIGKESAEALGRVARADGVIVKPNAPLLPTDATILSDARAEKLPLVAATYTDNGQRTAYVFACRRRDGVSSTVAVTPASLGMSGSVYAYDAINQTAKRMSATEAFEANLGQLGWGLYLFAPVGRSGIAFLGDAGKIVATGRQRVPQVQDENGKLTATVAFAPTEKLVTLHGYAASAPKAVAVNGTVAPVEYDAATGHFTAMVAPSATARSQMSNGDPINLVTVVFSAKP